MKLSLEGLKHQRSWKSAGICLPSFDVETVTYETIREPIWLHFGAGNIFRAFPAILQQSLIDRKLSGKGIIVCETFDEEIIEKVFLPFDNLSVSVALSADAEMKKTVVASIVHAIAMSKNFKELVRIFTCKSLQMASFTITEKGYALYGPGGDLLPVIASDMADKPEKAKSIMGIVTALCYLRYKAGKYPITLLSMDNCSHNGDKIAEAVTAIAAAWEKKGYVDKGFGKYIGDRSLVSFPLSMIDKITPRPSERVRDTLKEDGLEDMEILCTAKNTYVAPFVNAEETQYLIVEDVFTNGRPPLEEAGVIFTDRATVDKVEKMKVCTCLNPLHTILAVFGCMLGYKSISDEMKDDLLVSFIKRASYDEGMPVVVNPGIIDPVKFLDEVIGTRFPNPFVPDTPQRIACDTSQKIPVRFGETLKAYMEKGLDVDGLTYIPLFFAGWLRYLMGIDDNGQPFEISPDPMLPELKEKLGGIKLGAKSVGDKLKPVLSDKAIFGIDLYACSLGAKAEKYFLEMIKGPGAVKKTLERVIG